MRKKPNTNKYRRKVTGRRLALLLSVILAAGQLPMPIHSEEFPEEMISEEIRLEEAFPEEVQPEEVILEEMIFEEAVLKETDRQKVIPEQGEQQDIALELIPLEDETGLSDEKVLSEAAQPAETEPVKKTEPSTETEQVAEIEPTAGTEVPTEAEAPFETEAVTETEEPAEVESSSEIESSVETEPVVETEPAAETESPEETEPAVETEPAADTESPVETEPVAETEAVEEPPQPEQPAETEPAAETEISAEPETEPSAQIVAELISETEPEEELPLLETLPEEPVQNDSSKELTLIDAEEKPVRTDFPEEVLEENTFSEERTSGEREPVTNVLPEEQGTGKSESFPDRKESEISVPDREDQGNPNGEESAGSMEGSFPEQTVPEFSTADENVPETSGAETTGPEKPASSSEEVSSEEDTPRAGFSADRQEILLIPAPLEGETAYQQNVPVGIRVAELPESAGIRKISYRVQPVGDIEPSTTGILLEKDSPAEGVSGWKGSMVVPSDGMEGLVQVELEVEDWEGARTTQVMALDVDTVAPRITVEYDNNDVRNGKYFREPRTARIVIEDAHFDRNLVQIRQTAYGEAGELPIPAVRWTDQGSLHLAEITFDRDGAYTLEVEAEDQSGNLSALPVSDSAAPLSFIIDTRAGELWHLSGLEENGILGFDGYASDPDAEVELSFTGEDLEGYSLSLFRTRPDAVPDRAGSPGISREDVTGEILPQKEGDSADSLRFTIPPRDAGGISNDGWYTLSVCAWDLAGNRQEKTFCFQVNRFGSVYQVEGEPAQSVSAETDKNVPGTGSLTAVSRPGVLEGELVIREYNPSRLRKARAAVQREDGSRDVLLEGEEILRTEETWPGGAGYCYIYRIHPSDFSADGTYRLRLDSADMAGHNAEESESAGYELAFRVDATKPELVKVNGLEHSQLRGSSRTVQVEAFDASGIRRAEARVDGQTVWEKEDFADPTHIRGSFEVTEGEEREVQILLTDLAGNVLDTEEKDEGGEYSFLPDYPFARTVTIRQSGFGFGNPGEKGIIPEILFLAVLAVIPSAGLFYRKPLRKRAADLFRKRKSGIARDS